jgi:hypothetical protein
MVLPSMLVFKDPIETLSRPYRDPIDGVGSYRCRIAESSGKSKPLLNSRLPSVHGQAYELPVAVDGHAEDVLWRGAGVGDGQPVVA